MSIFSYRTYRSIYNPLNDNGHDSEYLALGMFHACLRGIQQCTCAVLGGSMQFIMR